MKVALFFILFLIHSDPYSQNPTPPCGNDYGSSSDEANIIQQMRFGSITNAVDAINQAKGTRGFALGCPQTALSYNTGDYSQPLLADVVTIWNSNHEPVINSFTINCPRIGRYSNNDALGAYYATLAGYYSNNPVLADVGTMMESQQYSSSNSETIDSQHEGVFGYIHVGSLNPCYPGGVVGSSVNQVCSNIPSYCVDYDYGLFAGENFLIGDQYEPLSFYDGGIAYDHGWIGIQMIEASIQQTDLVLKGKFKNSAILAANWAINEEVVKNHNYSSKLIWLLAEMYLWTGQTIYKDALNYKLDKNLLPSVLMDINPVDGNVDGLTSDVAFSDLTVIAQTPGRSWDGHNALPWYSAMNAWALTESYVAFRDRGDTSRANEIKPYAVAMLDNLAWEINSLGVIPDQLGVRDLAHSLLLGIWKIAQYENESHPNWETAAWAMWNSGYFDDYSTHSVCVGLYLIVLSETPYQPLFEREEFDSIQTFTATNKLSIFPNPNNEEMTLSLDNFENKELVFQLVDLSGQIVLEETFVNDEFKVNMLNIESGSYIVRIFESGQIKYVQKVVVNH